MRLKPFVGLALVVLLVCAACTATAQTVASATESHMSLSAGAGLSSYDVDWGKGRMLGTTAWGDYTPAWRPAFLRGLGVEGEWRDVFFPHPKTTDPKLKEQTFGGGLIYVSRHFASFQPYAKGLVSYGVVDFTNLIRVGFPTINSESAIVTSLGGGLEYRVTGHLWVRADYEYQYWPGFNPVQIGGSTLDPEGFTVGASYHFSRPQPIY